MDGSYEITTAWEEPKDLLDRREHAKFLTSMMTAKSGPYVLNLNAPWGFGKTFFIKSWAKSIEDDHPVVYINAWESDYSNDPLLAVMSAIDEQLIQALDDGSEIRKNVLERGGRLLRNIAPILVKGVAKKILNPDEADEAGEAFSAFTSDDASVLSEAIGNTTQKLIEEHRAKENSIKEFQSALNDLVNELSDDGTKYDRPIFIFVDEMDRCRPTYAVELLEAIKHLFSVDGIAFVIATDTEQLQYAIKAIYGDGFDGRQYLHRFFDQEFTLPYPEHLDFALALTHDEDNDSKFDHACFLPNERKGSSNILLLDGGAESLSTPQMLALVLSFMSQSFNLPLRSVQQVWDRFTAIVSTTTTNKWDVVWLFFLLCLQSSNADAFKKIASDMRNNIVSIDLNDYMEHSDLTMTWFNKAGFPPKHVENHMKASGIGRGYLAGIVSGQRATNDSTSNGPNNLTEYVTRRAFIEQRNAGNDTVPLVSHIYAVEQAGYLGGSIES